MNQHLEDLKEIRSMMERSTKFLSLSGLSGILVGFVATASAWVAFKILQKDGVYSPSLADFRAKTPELVMLAVATLAISVAIGLFFTVRKAKKQHVKVWNTSSKNLLGSMLIPLLTGGLFCLGAIHQEIYWMAFPAMLIFYGLALTSAAKYTLRDVYYLGLFEIGLGIFSLFLQKYNLLFWVLGFGFLHIVYGGIMHFKYDQKAE